MDPTIIAGGLKLLGGLLGSKKKSMSPQQSIMSTAAGARQAAKKYGFNALTLLAGSNATAGAGIDMGTPPLASLSVLGDLVEDQFGDDAKTRREHNQLQNELLRLEVDRARSLSVVAPPTAVGGASLTGGRAATQPVSAGVASNPFSMDVLTADREVRQTPTEDISGFMKVRNAWTDGDGFWVPGSDGEPLDIWQVPVVAGSWAASEAWELGSKVGAWLRDSPSSPIRRTDTKEYKEAPYGRDAYGRPLPKPEF